MPLVVTGRDSPAVRRRVADLGLAHAAYGAADKLAAAEALLATRCGFDWDRVAVIGDDWPDLPLLQRAAFACAPPNAHVEVRAAAHHVTAARGGYGAAREFCDLLLVAAGRYAEPAARPPALARWRSLTTSRRRPTAASTTTTRSTCQLRRPRAGAPTAPWHLRLLDLVSAYLPLVLMAVLAAGHLVAGAERAAVRGAARRPRRRATSPTT